MRKQYLQHTKFISVMLLRSHDGFFRTFADVLHVSMHHIIYSI